MLDRDLLLNGMNNIFFELTLVLIIAGGIATAISFLKQPAIIAYILTGLLIGPLGYYHLNHGDALSGLAQIGITLLLFMVGLELDVGQLRKIGPTALIAGLGQVFISTALVFGVLKALGFASTPAIFLGIIFSFSSTVIVVKLLGEKHDLQTLYGKLVLAILLIQDFVALVMLILLSGLNSAGNNPFGQFPLWQTIFLTLVKGAVVIWFVMMQSRYIFPKILARIGKSDELLLVFSLAWALGIATLVSMPIIGFTLETGGFLAGLALAKSSVHYQISARIKSLRDFFIIIFFIILGSQIVLNNITGVIVPGIILAIVVLVGKPFIVLLLLTLQGYKPRTAFFTGISLAQISEFSLIVGVLAHQLGYLDNEAIGVITLVAIITIALSSYPILTTEKFYGWLKRPLSVFNFRTKSIEQHLPLTNLSNHIILIGAHRLGEHIIDTLVRGRHKFIIVDFDPEVVEKFARTGLPAICGDISDPHIQELCNLEKARLVISTIPDFYDNAALIDAVKKSNPKAKLIILAHDENEALSFYEKDIDYALLPHFIGSLHLAKILSADRVASDLKKLRDRHLKLLKNI